MRHLSKVVWAEGMYLGPHHFQAQSRYFEDSIHYNTSSLWYAPFGVSGCEIDADALVNGTVSILHARGILPDGMVFNMPECDALPPTRQINDLFPVARDTLTAFLAIPPRRPAAANCAEESGGADTRYVVETAVVHDEITGRDEKPVRLGRKNFRLVFDSEPPGDLTTLAVARITRDGSGNFIPDPAFIPPCVQISASGRLMAILGRLIDILEEKSAALGGNRRAGMQSWIDYSTRDIANFWMLHTVNSALGPLRHLYQTKRGHPEELYVQLAQLGGALCTFAIESHPRDIPPYDHLRLDKCFAALDLHIRTHLETIVPTNCVAIPLEKARDYFWEGPVADQRCLGRARWILSVRARAGEVEIIQKTPQLVKICSQQYIGKLVERALPGMQLTHLPVPPSAVARRVDAQYFSVDRAGPCWDHIVQTRQVGVYVPGDLPDPVLELLVVLES